MEGGLKPMDAEQLRETAHQMVDFIADYYKNIETYPVLSQVQPGYLRELLPDSAPNRPESLKNVLDDVQSKILPGVTHWQSPSFFAYYPANSSVAGFLGEMLSSGHGGGVIQGSASESILVVMLAARDKILRKFGKGALEKLVVYASNQTHSALQKACQIAGIYPENCRFLETDSSENYALTPELVDAAISHDISAGLIPFFLCGTVGTTSSATVDPLDTLGKIAKNNDMWFHVDAAYAGSACICPEYRQYLDGVEEADSFNMNAHKWFLTNFDCSTLWVKDKSALIQALSTNPEFLKNKQYLRNHIELARHFEECVNQDPRFEVVAPRLFSLVCFRLVPPKNDESRGNKLNQELLEAVNSTGKVFMSHTALSGKYTLRVAIGAPLTEKRHMDAAWKVLQDEASSLLGTSAPLLQNGHSNGHHVKA
ncbi:Phenylacetaldehyde synthase [Linum perenne]